MPQFELLEVIEVNLDPKKGRSLAGLFTDYTFDNFADPKNPEVLDPRVGKLCFKINGNAFPYHDIVDFLERLPSMKGCSAAGDVKLVYDFPQPKSEGSINNDVKRILRTFHDDSNWVNQEGSMLSKEGIVDLIKQLHAQCQLRRVIDDNTPRDGRYLLIWDDNYNRHLCGYTGHFEDIVPSYCQVARWQDGQWRYANDEYTIDGTHYREL